VNRIHDVGGTEGYGPIEREPGEPPFHHEWEARVFVLNRLLLGKKLYNLDEFRHAIERMPPDDYRTTSYYARWAIAIERLLAEKGVLP
jgi:hypothetical protein